MGAKGCGEVRESREPGNKTSFPARLEFYRNFPQNSAVMRCELARRGAQGRERVRKGARGCAGGRNSEETGRRSALIRAAA